MNGSHENPMNGSYKYPMNGSLLCPMLPPPHAPPELSPAPHLDSPLKSLTLPHTIVSSLVNSHTNSPHTDDTRTYSE